MRVPLRMGRCSCRCLSLYMRELACVGRVLLAKVVLVCACRHLDHSVRVASDAAQAASCTAHSSAGLLPCKYMVHLWCPGLQQGSMTKLTGRSCLCSLMVPGIHQPSFAT